MEQLIYDPEIELNNMRDKTVWQAFQSLFRSKKKHKQGLYEQLTIKLPHYDYLRAHIFIDDLCDATDGEFRISLLTLTAILLKDFLKQISLGLPLNKLAESLQIKKNKYLVNMQHDFKQLSGNHWVLTESKVSMPRHKYNIVSFDIHSKALRRMKVLLIDLEKADATFNFNCEELLSVLIMDFVQTVSTGDHSKILSELIDRLSD